MAARWRHPRENLALEMTCGVAPRVASKHELLEAAVDAGWKESRPGGASAAPGSKEGGLALERGGSPKTVPRCFGGSLLRTCAVVLFQLTGLHLIGRKETGK